MYDEFVESLQAPFEGSAEAKKKVTADLLEQFPQIQRQLDAIRKKNAGGGDTPAP